jgi:predicted O-methyltransferase YrrM
MGWAARQDFRAGMNKAAEAYWRGKPGANVAKYRQAVVQLAQAHGARIIVEVGCWRGGLSRMLAELPDLQRLILVDSWQGSSPERQPPFYMRAEQAEMDHAAESVKAWAATMPNVIVLHMQSAAAAETIEDGSIDFVHIDADHTVEGVMGDIQAWLAKLRAGGILCGDNHEMPTVGQTVDRLLPRRRLAANGRVWWITSA